MQVKKCFQSCPSPINKASTLSIKAPTVFLWFSVLSWVLHLTHIVCFIVKAGGCHLGEGTDALASEMLPCGVLNHEESELLTDQRLQPEGLESAESQWERA